MIMEVELKFLMQEIENLLIISFKNGFSFFLSNASPSFVYEVLFIELFIVLFVLTICFSLICTQTHTILFASVLLGFQALFITDINNKYVWIF